MEFQENPRRTSETRISTDELETQSPNINTRLQENEGQQTIVESNTNQEDLRVDQLEEARRNESVAFTAKLPLSSFKIVSTMIKEELFNSFILYNVKFTWDDKEMETMRRLSDFSALRAAICNLLPFTYVFPVHESQLIV
jgi:hypothetical protein